MMLESANLNCLSYGALGVDRKPRVRGVERGSSSGSTFTYVPTGQAYFSFFIRIPGSEKYSIRVWSDK
jgi:hypothetical protein